MFLKNLRGEPMAKRVFLIFAALFFGLNAQIPTPSKKTAPAKKATAAPAVPVQKTEPQPAAATASELTVEQIIRLVQAGLSEDLIIAKIKKNNKAFDLSTEQILQLKKVGASDNIIRVLMDPQAQLVTVPAASPAVTPTEVLTPTPTAPANVERSLSNNLPEVDKATGIYLVEDGGKLTRLTRVAFTSQKIGTLGVMGAAMTMGALKTKIRLVLYGSSAKVRVQNKRPEFLFNLSEDVQPRDYVLIRLDKKSSTREAIAGSMRIGGPNMGFDEKKTLKFSAKEMAPGKYMLKLENDLAVGEYVFCPANGSLVAVYDFGIDP